jgi:hypothetical protein
LIRTGTTVPHTADADAATPTARIAAACAISIAVHSFIRSGVTIVVQQSTGLHARRPCQGSGGAARQSAVGGTGIAVRTTPAATGAMTPRRHEWLSRHSNPSPSEEVDPQVEVCALCSEDDTVEQSLSCHGRLEEEPKGEARVMTRLRTTRTLSARS